MFEIKPGARVSFIDNDGTEVQGSVNGAPWVYFVTEDDGGTPGVFARIPVYCDDHRTLDVAGENVRDVRV